MLDKKHIWAIFLLKFKIGHKAAETILNINKALGPGTANECTTQRWFKKFCKGNKNLEDTEHGSQPWEADDNQEPSL